MSPRIANQQIVYRYPEGEHRQRITSIGQDQRDGQTYRTHYYATQDDVTIELSHDGPPKAREGDVITIISTQEPADLQLVMLGERICWEKAQ